MLGPTIALVVCFLTHKFMQKRPTKYMLLVILSNIFFQLILLCVECPHFLINNMIAVICGGLFNTKNIKIYEKLILTFVFSMLSFIIDFTFFERFAMYTRISFPYYYILFMTQEAVTKKKKKLASYLILLQLAFFTVFTLETLINSNKIQCFFDICFIIYDLHCFNYLLQIERSWHFKIN